MSEAGDRGMTLLETLVVLAILGFISALSVVQVGRALDRVALREARGEVIAELKQARAQALRGGEPVTFAAADDGGSYGRTGHAMHALPDGVRMNQVAPIAFFPDGTAQGADITLSSARGKVLLPFALAGTGSQ